MHRLPLLGLILVCLAACDSPTATQRTASDVVVTPEDLHLQVSQVFELQATVRDQNGGRINRAEVEWQSSDPSVASVSGSGVVTARGGGNAVITARSGSVTGRTEISVAGPLTAECGSGLRLRVGEVYTAPAGEGALLCLDGDAAAGEYTLIPFYGTTVAGANEQFEVATRNTFDVSSPAVPRASVATMASIDAAPTEVHAGSADWELRLRRREAVEVAPLLGAAREAHERRTDVVQASRAAATALPEIGARLWLNVNAEKACTDPVLRRAEVVAVSERAIVLADTANPSGGFTRAEYAVIAAAFDSAIYPVVTRHFGAPSDVDRNGRTLIFFTRAVNEMSDGMVGGFFFSRDLLPRTGPNQQSACGASNEAEIVYLMVPDPARATSQSVFSKTNVNRGILAVIAHEFQHLVNASQRIFVQKSSTFEEVWLNEGMSHIAEELVGTHVGNIGRRENVSFDRITSSPQAWELYSLYHRLNMGRLAEHLRSPGSTALLDPSAPLASRGAAWQFLRYAADRKGGSEADFWRALAGGPHTGLRNLQAVIGDEPMSWMRDWAVSVYADDWVEGVGARWQQPGWDFRSVLSGVRADRTFPLETTNLTGNGTTTISLAAGGAAYLRFGVPAGARAEIRTTWNGGLTPSRRLLVSVVRTR